ncbi:MAG: GNAT family N-acetyltransferase [Eubacteriales bacterium]|nr:GNAT family N-acetyltransferase [Eubacteriales bacterium]
MLLETERLVIRSVEMTDEKAFVDMAADGSLAEDIGFDENCGSWMNNWIKENKELDIQDDPRADSIAYTIELKESGNVIGSVGCTYYDDMDKVGIVYFIGTKYRGSGYAAEAAKAYVDYFFEHYQEDELIAPIRDANEASCKTIEKVGFVLLEKKLYKDINEEYEIMHRFYAVKRL